MTTPRFALLVTVRVRPESVAAFRERILEAAASAVREEEHCHRFDVAQDEDDPTTFVFFEVYTDAAGLEFHHTTPHFLSFGEFAKDHVLEKTRQRLNLA